MNLQWDAKRQFVDVAMPLAIRTLVEDYGVANCRPFYTPGTANTLVRTVKDEKRDSVVAMPKKEYKSWIGRLLHIARVGRPDIMYQTYLQNCNERTC